MPRPKTYKKEKWKFIMGYGILYSISNMGRIRSNANKRIDPTGKKRRYAATKRLMKIVMTEKRPYPKVRLTDI